MRISSSLATKNWKQYFKTVSMQIFPYWPTRFNWISDCQNCLAYHASYRTQFGQKLSEKCVFERGEFVKFCAAIIYGLWIFICVVIIYKSCVCIIRYKTYEQHGTSLPILGRIASGFINCRFQTIPQGLLNLTLAVASSLATKKSKTKFQNGF